jgi:hypothetical protein
MLARFFRLLSEEALVEEYQRDGTINCGAGAYRWSPETSWQLLIWNLRYS